MNILLFSSVSDATATGEKKKGTKQYKKNKNANRNKDEMIKNK